MDERQISETHWHLVVLKFPNEGQHFNRTHIGLQEMLLHHDGGLLIVTKRDQIHIDFLLGTMVNVQQITTCK